MWDNPQIPLSQWFYEEASASQEAFVALSRVISTPSSADISLLAGRKVISEEGSWWITDIYAALKRERTLFGVYLNSPAIFWAR